MTPNSVNVKGFSIFEIFIFLQNFKFTCIFFYEFYLLQTMKICDYNDLKL